MKKTLNINLSGLVFTMDEDAYNTLKNYLDAIEKHFQNEAGKEEIIADIESRFAEEFSKKKSSSKEVMTLEDVNAVIATLGMVEDFTSEKNEPTHKEMPGDTKTTSRRLYRDSDHAMLGGVASGIANYFGVDVVWIRILFVVFTFAWGFAIPLYLLLWIITPKAETAAQKAEMMGAPLTIKDIEDHVKSMVNEGKETLSSFEKKNEGKITGFFREIGRGLKNLVKRFFSIFGSVIGFFLSLGAFVGIVFLGIGTGIVIVHRHSPEIGVNIFNYISPELFFVGILSLAGAILFPLFALFLLGVRLMKKRATFNSYVVSSMLVLWAACLIGSGTTIGKVAPQVGRMEADARQVHQGEQTTISEEMAPFESLSLDGAYSVQLVPGKQFSLKASGYEGDIKRMKFENTANELTLYQDGHQSGFCIFCSQRRIELVLTLPTTTLKSLILDGANEVYAPHLEAEALNMSVHGANKFTGNFTGNQLNVEEEGANHITLSGATEFGKFEISGASKMEAFELKIKDLHINMDGVSRANVNVQNSIEGEISGSAKIDYHGKPLNNLIIEQAGKIEELKPLEAITPPQTEEPHE